MVYAQGIGDTKSLYIVLKPLIDEIDFQRLKVSKKRTLTLESKLEKAVSEGKNPFLRGRLSRYESNNREIKRNLDNLKKYDPVIFIPGVSCKPARKGNIPKKVSIDPQADEFFLTDKILERAKHVPEAWENILFWPVSPVMWPFIVKDGRAIEHPLPETINKINRELNKKKKITFGSLTKTLDSRFNMPNYTFYESLFDSKKALNYLISWSPQLNELFKKHKKMEGVEKEMRDLSYLNNALMISAFGSIINSLKPKNLYGYFMKTSYSNNIFSSLQKHYGVKINILDCMRNAFLSPFGECDDSAVGLLEGLVLSLYQKKTRQIVKGSSKMGKKDEVTRIPSLKCHYYPFYLCADQRKCDKVSLLCAKDLIETLDKETLELIYKDTTKFHYGFQGIEEIICRLITEDDHYVTNTAGLHTSWLKERGDQKIKPLPIKSEKEFIGDLRASSLYNKCDLARIISGYQDLIPINVEKNDFAKIGTGEHIIAFTQKEDGYLPNKVLEKVGLKPVDRRKYCERFVTHKHGGITVTGHLDAGILIGDNIGIIDMKRTYTRNQKYQLLTYALSVNQKLGINPEKYYLIFAHRGYSGEVGKEKPPIYIRSGSYRSPVITIVTVKNDDPLIDMLHKRIKDIYSADKKILNNKEEMYIRKKVGEKTEICSTCLSDTKQYCDYLFSRFNDYKNLKQFFSSNKAKSL